MNNEPVATGATIYTVVVSLIYLGRVMGVINYTDEQVDAIMKVVELVGPIILSFFVTRWARSKVTPLDRPRDATLTQLVRVDNKPIVT